MNVALQETALSPVAQKVNDVAPMDVKKTLVEESIVGKGASVVMVSVSSLAPRSAVQPHMSVLMDSVSLRDVYPSAVLMKVRSALIVSASLIRATS